jgi:hypothetical protein
MTSAGSVHASELLDEARSRVSRGWCQGGEAFDGGGLRVDPWDPQACRWSLLGAIVASFEHAKVGADGRILLSELTTALSALAEEIHDPSLAAWNDDPLRTHSEVVAVLDGALGRLH